MHTPPCPDRDAAGTDAARHAGRRIKWLRENLFSSWVNAILTIVSLYVIYWVISHICPAGC
jgi:hypothetical protein